MKKVGALWDKQSDKAGAYLSGQLDLGALGKIRIIIMENKKESENQPDYAIFLPDYNKNEKDDE